jgi:hypothetical protein
MKTKPTTHRSKPRTRRHTGHKTIESLTLTTAASTNPRSGSSNPRPRLSREANFARLIAVLEEASMIADDYNNNPGSLTANCRSHTDSHRNGDGDLDGDAGNGSPPIQ